ncbi:hypothetical protein Cgig2_003167 [Carnegiea gigantea]|uniref:ADP-ribosylation factor n=1 Tax=Carnegiea gigantea TaxID=171969 RepID=A0A9Q1K3F8_9CARY|nr:hypothetical protein Cgig2_003167 [Carnegiea gigantea]
MLLGFNVETVEYKNISFTVWDVGGQDKASALLTKTICETLHCKSITVEISSKGGLERQLDGVLLQKTLKRILRLMTKEEYEGRLLDNFGLGVGEFCRSDCSFSVLCLTFQDELRDAVLLVFANKQDLPNAMNAAEITDKLGLHSLRQRHWLKRTHWSNLAVVTAESGV